LASIGAIGVIDGGKITATIVPVGSMLQGYGASPSGLMTGRPFTHGASVWAWQARHSATN